MNAEPITSSTPSFSGFISEVRKPLFWAKVQRRGPDECWEWSAYLNKDGYGYYQANRYQAAHRLAYMLTVGQIPVGMHLDHLCRNRACCNPAHLEPVTPRENIMRGEGVCVKHAAKTHCVHGHPLSGDNLWLRWDGRRCRTCRNHSNKMSSRRKRGKA